MKRCVLLTTVLVLFLISPASAYSISVTNGWVIGDSFGSEQVPVWFSGPDDYEDSVFCSPQGTFTISNNGSVGLVKTNMSLYWYNSLEVFGENPKVGAYLDFFLTDKRTGDIVEERHYSVSNGDDDGDGHVRLYGIGHPIQDLPLMLQLGTEYQWEIEFGLWYSDYGPDGELPDYPPSVESTSSALAFCEFEIAPTPIPGAVWLLGSGLVGLVGLRSKKRRQ